MTSLPSELIDMAHAIGFNVPFWVQGAGGNVSVKSGDHLWIKASGARLDKMSASHGFAAVDLLRFEEGFTALLQKPSGDERETRYSRLLSECQSPHGVGKPSMETGFHALLPGRRVYHFHSLAAMAMAQDQMHKSAKALAAQFDLEIAFVDLVKPGVDLTAAVVQNKSANVHILSSHGVILQGNDESILKSWLQFEDEFLEDLTGGELALKVFAKKSVSETLRFFGGSVEFAWRNLFPDGAVFEAEILAQLSSKANAVTLTQQRWDELVRANDFKTAGFFEIALATYLLMRCVPSLRELPSSYSSSVVSLPVEQFRKEQS